MVKAFVVLLSLLLAGCQTLSERRQANILQDTLWQYEAAMRWGDLSQAQAFAADAQAVADYQANPEIRITRYEVVQGPSMLDPHHAVQSVAIGYVFESSQRVNELIDQQVWQYDAEGKRWLRQSPIPEFR